MKYIKKEIKGTTTVVYSYTCRCKQKHKDDLNERTNTLLYKNIPLTLYSRKGCERVDVGHVWVVNLRQGQTAIYWPKVLLATIAALLPRIDWAAQPWVAEGPSPLSAAGSHSARILSPTATGTELELTRTDYQTVCGTWLYNCLTYTFFLLAYASLPNSTTSKGQGDIPIFSTGCACFFFTQVHLLVDGSFEGQYVT